MKNKLKHVDIQGRWCDNSCEVKHKVQKCFGYRFNANDCNLINLNKIKFSALSQDDNKLLTRYIDEAKINVVNQCRSAKSPGFDGFNFHFLKNCWGIDKDDIVEVVDEFQQVGKIQGSMLQVWEKWNPSHTCQHRHQHLVLLDTDKEEELEPAPEEITEEPSTLNLQTLFLHLSSFSY